VRRAVANFFSQLFHPEVQWPYRPQVKPKPSSSMSTSSSTSAKPYGTVVHMFTIFFYVLMSLALKETLASTTFAEQPQKWLCFIAALFLLSRFLFGSSSHLYAEHAEEKDEKEGSRFFMWHLIWIMVFAILGARICFSENVADFLEWNGWYGLVALIASALDRKKEIEDHIKFSDGWAGRWLIFNGVHAMISFLCLKWQEASAGGSTLRGFNSPLIVLSLVLFILLLLDFRFQLRKLHTAFFHSNEPKPAS
jgi:hypothetical protein